MNSFA